MDIRYALKKNTVLEFSNSDCGIVSYRIEKEIGRGASSIVYSATYKNNAGQKRVVRIKECYPFKLMLERAEDGTLICDEKEGQEFDRQKRRFRDCFVMMNGLFCSKKLTNAISNTLDIYEANNTLYVVTTYMQGSVLSDKRDLPVRKYLEIMRSVSVTIGRIHDEGYLYLDLKPENIFVLDEVTDLVQLFDFDSLLKISKKGEQEIPEDFRISFTKGFASLEQQTGCIRKLGRHSDVYGIGAVLFYMIFRRIPTAMDCDIFAEYDYADSILSQKEYHQKLYNCLNDFFRHTLASYYQDRYGSMREVTDALNTMLGYADTHMPYLISSSIHGVTSLVGREEELEKLEEWYRRDDGSPMYISGIGGIGKSSLVREFLQRNANRFDCMVYAYQTENGSLRSLICDDEQIQINDFSCADVAPRESLQEDYYRQKLSLIRKIIQDTHTILIIDDFTDFASEDLADILDMSWRVIFVTRNELPDDVCHMNLKAIQNRKDLRFIFQKNLNRTIASEEMILVDQIIDQVQGHTLAIELIAKQVESSFLTLKEAADLMKHRGFSRIAPEKLRYQKDNRWLYQSLYDIVTSLVTLGRMSKEASALLKILTLTESPGIDIGFLQESLELKSKDPFNELNYAGLLKVEGRLVHLHPVIKEAVSGWDWTEETVSDALHIFQILRDKICEYGTVQDMQYFQKSTNVQSHRLLPDIRFGKKDQVIRDIMQDHIIGKKYKSQSEFARLHLFLRYSEKALTEASKWESLSKTVEYKELLYAVLIRMPVDREEFVFRYVDSLLLETEHVNPHALLKLCDIAAFLYENADDYDNAFSYIAIADRISKAPVYREEYHYLRGMYYDIAADYYDNILDGDYYGGNPEGLKKLIHCIDKSIFHMKRAGTAEARTELTRYMISKSVVLLRSRPEDERAIRRLLSDCRKLLEKDNPLDSPNHYFYYMSLGWYYTYVRPDVTNIKGCAKRALNLSKYCTLSDLDRMNDIMIPIANMYYEIDETELGERQLRLCLDICEKHKGQIPYQRLKMDIYSHLWDNACIQKNQQECWEILKTIIRENGVCESYGIAPLVIPEDILEHYTSANPEFGFHSI